MIGFYRRLVEAGRGDEQVFKSWNVIESSGVFAFTYGANIFISRGAFTERYFNALVAHEIGHLHQRDGLILQALHSLTYPLFNHLLFNPTTIQKELLNKTKTFPSPILFVRHYFIDDDYFFYPYFWRVECSSAC